MAHRDEKLKANELESYFRDIEKQISKIDKNVIKNRKDLDKIDKDDIQDLHDALEVEDALAFKSALFLFFQRSLSRGRTVHIMARMLGLDYRVITRYLDDYWHWVNGVTSDTKLSLQTFDNAVNDYKKAAQALNRMIDLFYRKAVKYFEDEATENIEVSSVYFTNLIKACEALAAVQTKYQELCCRLGLHDKLVNHFHKVDNDNLFNDGDLLSNEVIGTLEKRGITHEELQRIRNRIQKTRQAMQLEQDINI